MLYLGKRPKDNFKNQPRKEINIPSLATLMLNDMNYDFCGQNGHKVI